MGYHYIKDNKGSVRVTLNETGAVAGYDDYYPFGLPMSGRYWNQGNDFDDQKFTGHFLEQEGGLGIYHAGARMYDPEVPRFYGVDGILQLKTPIELLNYEGAKHLSFSPYVYVRNNPLLYYDPDGLTDWKAIGKGAFQVVSGVTGMAAGATLFAGSAGITSTGLGAGLGLPGMLGGSALFGLGGAYFGTGISNIREGFKASEGITIETSENVVTTIATGLGANETQAEISELGFSLFTGGGPFKIGKLFSADKPVQGTKQGVIITNHIKNISESYEKEYLQKVEVERNENK